MQACHSKYPRAKTFLGRKWLIKCCRSGKDLVIKATGTVKQDIEKGAYVLLQVKYGLIRLISTKADLCEQIENVDLECPIEKGDLTVTKSVKLPAEIPPVCASLLSTLEPSSH